MADIQLKKIPGSTRRYELTVEFSGISTEKVIWPIVEESDLAEPSLADVSRFDVAVIQIDNSSTKNGAISFEGSHLGKDGRWNTISSVANFLAGQNSMYRLGDATDRLGYKYFRILASSHAATPNDPISGAARVCLIMLD